MIESQPTAVIDANLLRAFQARYRGRPDRLAEVVACAVAWEALKVKGLS